MKALKYILHSGTLIKKAQDPKTGKLVKAREYIRAQDLVMFYQLPEGSYELFDPIKHRTSEGTHLHPDPTGRYDLQNTVVEASTRGRKKGFFSE